MAAMALSSCDKVTPDVTIGVEPTVSFDLVIPVGASGVIDSTGTLNLASVEALKPYSSKLKSFNVKSVEVVTGSSSFTGGNGGDGSDCVVENLSYSIASTSGTNYITANMFNLPLSLKAFIDNGASASFTQGDVAGFMNVLANGGDVKYTIHVDNAANQASAPYTLKMTLKIKGDVVANPL